MITAEATFRSKIMLEARMCTQTGVYTKQKTAKKRKRVADGICECSVCSLRFPLSLQSSFMWTTEVTKAQVWLSNYRFLRCCPNLQFSDNGTWQTIHLLIFTRN